MTEWGLGAHPSPPDARDWPLPALAAPLPRRFVASGMGPVLNQGSTPQCVAHAAVGMKQWQEKRDGHGVVDFSRPWLHAECKARDGIPGEGTDLRTAMKVLRARGCAVTGRPGQAALGMIAAYYAVPITLDALKAAIAAYGPVTVAGAWHASWFRPVRGVLPAPSGGIVGGHAVLAFGWDDDVAGGSLLLRNSWGRAWPGSTNGNFYAPARAYVASLWEAWKAADLITGGK